MSQHSNGTDEAPELLVTACWSCHGPLSGTVLFCPTCQAVQPPSGVDHFTRLGLERRFDVDPEVLEQSYFRLQRRLHPDRFTTKSPREKALSQSQAMTLNTAYECLKTAPERAVYMLHLHGIDVLADGCNLVNDQALLLEAMEMREALAEAETEAEMSAVIERTAADVRACVTDLETAFHENDFETACRLTTRLKYLCKLTEEARLRGHRQRSAE